MTRLRTRIILLVLLAVAPAWGVIFHNFFVQRQLTISAIQEDTLALARFAAQEDEQFLQSTRELLLTLSHFISLYGNDPVQCNRFFANLLGRIPSYLNFGAATPNGNLFCMADSASAPRSLAQQPWFQQAFLAHDFVIGDFRTRHPQNNPYLVMAYPVFEFERRPRALVFAVLDISVLSPFHFKVEEQLPKHSTLELVVAGEPIPARRSESGRSRQQSVGSHLLAELIRNRKAGVVEGAAVDGTPSLFAVAPLESGLRRNRVFILLTVPKQVAFLEANRGLRLNLLTIGMVALLALAAAWIGGGWVILRPITAISKASERIADGDLKARTGVPTGSGELGDLAKAFDLMTEKLEIHELELRNSREQLRDLASHMERIREQERTRIAREIHDNLGQTLTALKFDLAWLNKRVPGTPPEATSKIATMSALIDQAISTIHKVSDELRPAALDDLGLASAVEWQVEEFEERTGIHCEIHATAEDERVSRELATSVFRILQEALTNAARHAQATALEVGLEVRQNRLVLEVRDNGLGISEEALAHPKSFGIIGMRERVHLWGGTVSITGSADQGTRVLVTIPLEP